MTDFRTKFKVVHLLYTSCTIDGGRPSTIETLTNASTENAEA